METILNLVKEYCVDMFYSALIMTSCIIVLIGLLKPILFNKITCKPLRKAILAFSNVALSFVSTAICFFVKNMTFEFYWQASIGTAIFSILCYWLYENTCLRNLIEKIGKMVLKKLSTLGLELFTAEEKVELEKEIKLAVEEIENKTKKEVKLATAKKKSDKELENLK